MWRWALPFLSVLSHQVPGPAFRAGGKEGFCSAQRTVEPPGSHQRTAGLLLLLRSPLCKGEPLLRASWPALAKCIYPNIPAGGFSTEATVPAGRRAYEFLYSTKEMLPVALEAPNNSFLL